MGLPKHRREPKLTGRSSGGQVTITSTSAGQERQHEAEASWNVEPPPHHSGCCVSTISTPPHKKKKGNVFACDHQESPWFVNFRSGFFGPQHIPSPSEFRRWHERQFVSGGASSRTRRAANRRGLRSEEWDHNIRQTFSREPSSHKDL